MLNHEVCLNSAPSVIDCTLREGMQAAGVQFNVSHSADIARALRGLGVDMIEAGHAQPSPLLERPRVWGMRERSLRTWKRWPLRAVPGSACS